MSPPQVNGRGVSFCRQIGPTNENEFGGAVRRDLDPVASGEHDARSPPAFLVSWPHFPKLVYQPNSIWPDGDPSIDLIEWTPEICHRALQERGPTWPSNGTRQDESLNETL